MWGDMRGTSLGCSWDLPTTHRESAPAICGRVSLAAKTSEENEIIIVLYYMPDWHSGFVSWLSSMLTNALQFRSQSGMDYFVLSVCCCVWFLASLCYQEYSCMYSYMGELTVWIVFPTVTIRMYISWPLVPLDSCLTAAACLSSAC